MDRDVAKLQVTARDLSELGLALSNRTTSPDRDLYVAMGDAFVALSEAIIDISSALERGAKSQANESAEM